jgi:hypothetical protein
MNGTQAERTLDEVHRLRGRTSTRVHQGAWLPALLVALLLLASAALYRYPFTQPHESTVAFPFWAGLPSEQRAPVASYVFWFLGTPALFAAVAAWYRWRAHRVGMRVSWPVAAATGLGVLLLLAVFAAVPVPPPPDELTVHPPAFVWPGGGWPGWMTPLVPLALAVIVLARVERSWALAAAGLWIGLLAVWLCSSRPPGHIPFLFGGSSALSFTPGHFLIVLALPLLVFAAVRGLWTGRRRS